VGAVRVEIDAGDVARRAGLVALEQEVRSVVVGGIGAGLAVEHEVGVLVGLGLVGLDQVGRARKVARGGKKRAVAVVAVEGRRRGGAVGERDGLGVLERK